MDSNGQGQRRREEEPLKVDQSGGMTRRKEGRLTLWGLVWVTGRLVLSLMEIGEEGREENFIIKKVLEVRLRWQR